MALKSLSPCLTIILFCLSVQVNTHQCFVYCTEPQDGEHLLDLTKLARYDQSFRDCHSDRHASGCTLLQHNSAASSVGTGAIRLVE